MTQDSNRADGEPTNPNGTADGPVDGTGRRSVLRRSVTALAAGFGGLAIAARPANATDCPQPPVWWRSNPDEWPSFSADASLLLLDESGEGLLLHPNDDQERILEELSKTVGDDVYLRLVKQYVAAMLNRQGVRPHPDGFEDFWDRIAAYHRWAQGADRPQQEWEVDGIHGGGLYGYFRQWNSGIGWPCGVTNLETRYFSIRPY